IGLVGFGLMTTAFALVGRRGGWQRAMQPDPGGRWSLPRKLMAAGAALACLFAGLMFVPGVIPWWGYGWVAGGGFGFFLGIAFSQLLVVMTRPHAQNQQPTR